jgi:hypothetical protein
MSITGVGWEMLIQRKSVQKRASDGKPRTVGTYQVFHNGVARTGDLKGTVAESKGPGANKPAGNGRRVEAGTYPISTQGGEKYVTIGYVQNNSTGARPKPGIELNQTGERSEILIHPGQGFLSSVGCLNLCKSLPKATEPIDYIGSRRRVIAVIEDLKDFLDADFPKVNGRKIPRASVVIEGEP